MTGDAKIDVAKKAAYPVKNSAILFGRVGLPFSFVCPKEKQRCQADDWMINSLDFKMKNN
jgi:hypothetical protein